LNQITTNLGLGGFSLYSHKIYHVEHADVGEKMTMMVMVMIIIIIIIILNNIFRGCVLSAE